jgi:hypothetical protein
VKSTAALALAVALAAPSLADDLFRVPKDQVVSRVHVIALAPLRVATRDAMPPEIEARWESVLSAELAAAGAKVVPSPEYARVWRGLAEQLGGIWDPVTGDANDEKRVAARRHTFGELQRLDAIDAVVDWRLEEARVLAKESCPAGQGRLEREGSSLDLKPVYDRPNRVVAARLRIALSDRNDVTLYAGAIDVTWLEVRRGDFVERRPLALAFAPECDARLRELLKPLRDAYAEAQASPSGRTSEASPP